MPDLAPWQWTVGVAIGLLAGLSKTGVPGIGILMVPLMPLLFPGNESVGALLPILIGADVFAVVWYRHHARWDLLWRLYPTVLLGIALGYLFLDRMARSGARPEALNPWIGGIVLAMLAVALLRRKYGERIQPEGWLGTQLTGAAAGVSTTLANAGGPVMALYFSAVRLPKNEFLGTSAWYFFSLNLLKVPLYAALTLSHPGSAFFTRRSLMFDLLVLPAIVVGALAGKKVQSMLSQDAFDAVVWVFSAAFALRLLAG